MLKYLVYSAVNNAIHNTNIVALLKGLAFVIPDSKYQNFSIMVGKKIGLIFFLPFHFLLSVSITKLNCPVENLQLRPPARPFQQPF